MKLGILVNTDRHPDHIVGITRAALSRGHDVTLFIMDDGTKLLNHPGLCSLSRLPGVQMSFCRLSARRLEVETVGVSCDFTDGSQYNNAQMVHQADRVIVL